MRTSGEGSVVVEKAWRRVIRHRPPRCPIRVVGIQSVQRLYTRATRLRSSWMQQEMGHT
jgi:hypothetical protein